MAELASELMLAGCPIANGFLACGIVMYGSNGELLGVNSSAQTTLGLTDGRKPPEELGRLASQAFAEARDLGPRELLAAIPNGSTRKLRAFASLCHPTDSGPSVALVMIQPIIPPADTEAQLWRLERLAGLGTVAASMAHEIRNALVAGKTFLDLLLEKNQDSEISGIVRRELDRIDGIATRMLKFASPPAAVRKPVRLSEVLQHMLRLVKAQSEGKSVSISQEFAAEPDLVLADPAELEQAFFNLLLNAVDATAAHGTIMVNTRRLESAPAVGVLQKTAEKSWVGVTIQDSGSGIAPEHLARLFEPFFTTKAHGTGLGLLITKRIIQQHSGELKVESTLGKGTCFQISLPALPG
jgi:two-component system sensor histidine kinase HydH